MDPHAARAALHDALFRPASVALIGLSSDDRRPSGRPLGYLRKAGFGGRVYVVNPRRDEVQGADRWDGLGRVLPSGRPGLGTVMPNDGGGP